MSPNKILVIGSNSFSGSHFVSHALKEGNQVWGVSRSQEPDNIFLPYYWPQVRGGRTIASKENFTFTRIDLNKDLTKLIELIDSIKANIIVNFASQGMVAESWLNPTDWYKTNVVSQVAFHDELRKRKFIDRYIHITTPEVYGSTNEGWIKEDKYFSPSTPYAVSRACCDMHLQSFFKAYEFPVIFTRAANVFGPGQQLYRIIPRALLSARTGKPMQLHGGGNSIRSFIHISDVVKATLKLSLEGEPGSTWHISTKESISIRDLVKLIFSLTNSDFDALVKVNEDRLGKDQCYLLNSEAIRSKHGWSDEIELSEGLKETLAWVDQNLERLVKLPWTYKHTS